MSNTGPESPAVVSLADRQLGDYQILELLGAGGMGEVYRARDDRLHRFVALKVLPRAPGSEAESRRRLLAEARAAAALTHPYICKVYEVAEDAGRTFIVMECVTGETMRARLLRGRLPIRTGITLAIELAEALDHAHAHAVVHRDLKPSNIMLADGHVKVLDFGLATSAVHPAPPDAKTETSPVTEPGTMKGTLAYMAPEQLSAEAADARADIFAFGIILFEMLTGQHPFPGRSGLDTASAILRTEPAAWPQGHDAPPLIRHIVRKSLAKDPADRYQTMHDVLTDLRTAAADLSAGGSASTGGSPVAAKPRRWWRVAALASAAAALTAGGIYYGAGRHGALGEARHEKMTFAGDLVDVELSPDGGTVAYVRPVGSDGALFIQDTKGGPSFEIARGSNLRRPRWSPSGDLIMYTAGKQGTADGRGVYVTAKLGGLPRRVSADGYAAWSPDGTSVAAVLQNGRAITITNLATQTTARTLPIDDIQFVEAIDWSPTSNRLLILERTPDAHLSLSVVPLDQPIRKLWTTRDAVSDPRWAKSAELIYCFRRSGDTMELLALNPDRPNAAPEIVLADLPAGTSLSLADRDRSFVYVRRTSSSNLLRFDLTDPARPPVALTSGTGQALWPAISPDGRWVAGVSVRGSRRQIVKWPIDGGDFVELTSGQGFDQSPRWSPDGSQIVFASLRNDRPGAWIMRADGSQPQELQVGPLGSNLQVDWFSNGVLLWQAVKPGQQNYLSFQLRSPGSNITTWLTQEDSTGWVFNPRKSPTGDDVAVHWNRSRAGLYLILGYDRTERFLAEGHRPIGWAPDGKTIYALKVQPSPNIVTVSVTDGEIRPLLTVREGNVTWADVSRDGRILVATAGTTQSDAWRIENFTPRRR